MVIDIRPAYQYEAHYLTELALRSKSFNGYSDTSIEVCRNELTIQPTDVELDRLYYFVAEEGKKIVGFYSLECVFGSIFKLDGLFVEPEYIDTEVECSLVNHAKAKVNELGGHTIKIQSDPGLDWLYEKMGGEYISKKESHNIDGQQLSMFHIAIN